MRARYWAGLLVLLLLCMAFARIQAVRGYLPYSQQPDEIYFAINAGRILETGDLNPHFFRYPSLPIYINAASMAIGKAFAPDDAPIAISVWGRPNEPAVVYAIPRFIFSLVSIATAACLAIVAWHLFGPAFALLVPLLLSLSALYQYSAVRYLNVDIWATFFVCATLTAIFARWDRDTWLDKAIVPGVLAGMAVASKYNSGLILVPCALAIHFNCREQRFQKLVALGGVSAIAFFICVPYSILDAGYFIEQVLFEIEHYRQGHPNSAIEPGLPQLVYYWRSIATDFGGELSLLALLGVAYGLLTDWRRTLTLISMPLLMILHMSTNRLNYLRTVLPVFAIVTVLQAGGVRALVLMLQAAFQSTREGASSTHSLQHRAWPGLLAGMTLLLVASNLPLDRLFDRNAAPDTRNQVVSWLWENATDDSVILIADDAWFDPRDIEKLDAQVIAPGLRGLEDELDGYAGWRRLVVLPTYEMPVQSKGPVKQMLEAEAGAAPSQEEALQAHQIRRSIYTPKVARLNQKVGAMRRRPNTNVVLDLRGASVRIPKKGDGRGSAAADPRLVVIEIPAGT